MQDSLHTQLQSWFHLQGRVQEAIACYEHVSLLQAESPEAHANLASAYKDAGRQDTAIVSYQKALQLRPDFPEAFANLVHSLQCVCEWKDRPQLFSRMESEVHVFASQIATSLSHSLSSCYKQTILSLSENVEISIQHASTSNEAPAASRLQGVLQLTYKKLLCLG